MQRTSARSLFAFTALALASLASSGQPYPGAPDPSFGSNGVVYVNIGKPVAFELVGTVRQGDGKLVIGGNAALAGECGGIAFARFNMDGTLDTSYGTGGWVAVTPPTYCPQGPTTLQAMSAPQYGGMVTFVGRSDGQFAAGSVWGDYNGGSVSFARDYQVPPGFTARAMATHPYNNWSIVAGYDNRDGMPGRTTAFVRLNGEFVDLSFGTNGVLKAPMGTESDEAAGIVMDHDGAWWAAGTVRDAGSATGTDMYVARFLSSGALDMPWGGNGSGRRIVDFAGLDDSALSLTRDQQQQLLVGGRATYGSGRLPALARLRYETGEMYPAFGMGGAGISMVPISPDEDGEFSAVLATGWTDNVATGTLVHRASGARRTLIYRFDNTGWASYSFGPQGMVHSTAITEPRGFFLGDGYSQAFFLAGTSPDRKAMLAKYDMYGAMASYGGGIGRAFDAPQPAGAQGNTIDEGGAMALLADGGIVMVGQARVPVPSGDQMIGGVVRLTASGQRDTTFGSGAGTSYLMPPAGLTALFPRAVASDAEGRLVVGSTANADFESRFVVTRLLADGSRDPAWNGGSDVVLAPGAGVHRELMAVAVQPDGAVLLAGQTDPGQNGRMRIVLARLLANGAVDYAFGSMGQVVWGSSAPTAPSELANGLLIEADGRILVAAAINDGGGTPRFAVLRLMPNGAPDPSWGFGFAALGPAGGAAFGLARQPDGRLVAGGDCVLTPGAEPTSCIVRFTTDGMPDPAFGNGGVFHVPALVGGGYNGFVGVAVQPDGKIVAGGDGGGYAAFVMARARAGGEPDFAFGGGQGYVVPVASAWARSFAMTADGKLLLAGSSFNGDLVVARSLGGGDDTPDPFQFAPANGVAPASLVTSAPVTPTGYDLPTFAYVDLGEVATGDCTNWTSTGAYIQPGQAVCVRHTSAAESGASVTSTVSIGGTTATFTSTTGVLETTITSQPASPSMPTVVFQFTASVPTATFQCRLDGGVFGACASPVTIPGLPDGTHVFEVRAVSGASVDPTPASVTFTVDGTAPDTVITAGPEGSTNVSLLSFAFASNDPSATFECSVAGSPFFACVSPKETGFGDGTYTFAVRAVDAAGNRDPSPASRTFTVDRSAPDTTIFDGPSGVLASTAASFLYSSNEAGATFECRLDGAAFAPCASGASYSGLAEGAHTFEVRAVDAAGNRDPSPATRSWTVDTVAPDTSFVSAPSGTVASTSATLAFHSLDGGSFFMCSLDGAPFASCPSPVSLTGLAEGAHTFRVYARDAAGNADATPATATWIVDTVAPQTTVTSGPGGTVVSSSATIVFSADDAGATFQCRLDGGGYAACASPLALTGLAEGAHVLEVRAVDAAGNVDASAASIAWTVDTTAADAFITSAPSGAVASTTATVAFTSEAGAAFECSLDAGAYGACTSPVTLTGLAQGSHTFLVRARDAWGNVDATPASATWIVDTVAPDTTLTGGPSGNNQPPTATFTFTSSEAGGSFECRLDGAPFTPCASGVTYTALPKGLHAFEVRALDAAGNVDATPATRSWRSN